MTCRWDFLVRARSGFLGVVEYCILHTLGSGMVVAVLASCDAEFAILKIGFTSFLRAYFSWRQ